MPIPFDVRHTDRLRLRSERVRGVRLAAILVSVIASTVASRAKAQAPGEEASAQVAMSAANRATFFLRNLSTMSPTPLGADADHAQAWPRMSWRTNKSRSGDQIVRIARKEKVDVTGDEDSPDPRYGPHWTVKYYDGEIEVSLDPACVSVGRFVDLVLVHALERDPPPEESTCLLQDAAIRRGLTYAKFAGIDLAGLTLYTAQLVDTIHPPTAAGRTWEIRWARQWNGVELLDQDLNMSLDAGYGRLISFHARMGAPIPADTRLILSATSSATLAARFLTELNWPPAGLPTVALRIVLPTDRWTSENGRINTRSKNSRLAWVVRTPVRNPKDELDESRYVEVWIDCANGAVVGGDTGGSRGRGAKRALSAPVDCVLRVLGAARSLQVQGVERGAAARKIVPGKDSLRFYGALSQLLPLPPAGAAGGNPATHRVLVHLPGGKSETLSYDAKSGVISDKDGNAAKAAKALRALLDTKDD